MKISHNWLLKYIDLPYSTSEISEMLTTIGLEVEGLEEVSSIKGGLKGVVIGKVVECEKHADADKLSITKVDLGSDELHQIICGAPNVAKGQKVLVATIGSTLYPASGDPITIKKAKIRGVESYGMICASDELGMGEDHSGILVLPEDAVVGANAADYYEILNDVIYEIGLTPNRSDATCHLGVAKDLYAYIKINKNPNATFNEPSSIGFNIESNSNEIKVNLNRPDLCPRFTGLTISNIVIKESPHWLKNQLSVLGIKSINNVVDITNYILHELGQPLHAYDAEKISGRTINVGTLPKGYKYLALDGKEIELNGEELMVCDGDLNGMCIGGVYGGKESGVTNVTTNIFLEAAHFNAGNIRRTSMFHNLRTDAAKVFEKGSDPNICLLALKRAANLIVKYADGVISSDVTDVYPKEIKNIEIHLKYENVKNIIGDDINNDDIQEILNALDMEVHPVDDYSIKVFVPTNKADVLREIDVIEEILRIYGLNNVSIPTKLNTNISYTPKPNKVKILNSLFDALAANGFNEMMGISLLDSKICLDSKIFEPTQLVYINNTSNVGLDVMRPSMLLSGLGTVAFNLNRKQENLRLFEYGKTYLAKGEESIEVEFLSIFVCGKEGKEHWSNPKPKSFTFYDAKSTIESMLNKYYLNDYNIEEIVENKNGLQYGLNFKSNGKNIGSVGEVDASALKLFGIKQKVYYAEIALQALISTHLDKKMYVKEISRFPTVSRDLAIVIDKKVNFDVIEKSIRASKLKYLTTISLFDIYENAEQLGSDKKSYALNFNFENLEKTLTDTEIEEGMNKIIKVCELELGAVIRK